MRLFVRMMERPSADPQEYTAMLRHRLGSIKYQHDLLTQNGPLAYAFRSSSGNESVLMLEVDTLEAADFLLKRDPGWPYCETDVVPVVSTKALVHEAQEYLGETIISDAEMQDFKDERRRIDPHSEYWLAYKKVKPFSPLLPAREQDDVHRRTVRSQRAHLDVVEFCDDNPVGKAVGITIAEGSIGKIQLHVESCEVFPDTTVEYTKLLPLEVAWQETLDELRRLRRPLDGVPSLKSQAARI